MLSFGFYNSKGGDRKYDAEQFGAMFNGIITDGVFAHYKNALKVTAGDGNRELVVSSGRAWFNGTWTEVDDNGHSIYLMGSAVETTYFVYLAVNKNSRKNSVAWYSNIVGNSPDKGLYFYLLAQVTVPGGVNKITDAMITDTRGSDLCPYVTGIMETVSFEEIVKRVCGDNWQDWLGVYEAGITTGVQNAVRASSEALSEVKSLKAYSVESEAVSYTWAKFEAIATGGGGFEWATDSVHTELADPPMPVCLFRDLSYADLGAGFKPSIYLGSPYRPDGETTTKPVPASTQAKVWKEYPYFWEGGGAYGTEVLRYDDLQRVIVTSAGVAAEKYRYRISRLVYLPVTYEPGAYIGTVTADNATAYPRGGYKDGYWYMRFASKAEDVSFYYPGLSAKNVRDAIIEVVKTGGTGGSAAMSIIEVEELPATGVSGVMYVVKKSGDSDAVEYLWLDRWEKIGGTGSGQNVAQVEPVAGDKPRVYVIGEAFSDMNATKNEVILKAVYVSQTRRFTFWIKIKWQGASSVKYPKHNFTVKCYEDEACTKKLKLDFMGWGKQNKFVWKANYIDHSHARNIINARLWAQIVKSRSNYDTLPEEYKNSPNMGAVDGFPFKLYVNGSYYGIYTWNIPKDAWMTNMDEDNPKHILFCCSDNDNGRVGDYAFNFRALWGGISEKGGWDIEVGTQGAATTATLNNLISCVKDTDDATFLATIGTYLDIPSAIDYLLFIWAMQGVDSAENNMLLLTYDGVKLYCGGYDMDATWGISGAGAMLNSYTYDFPADYMGDRSLLWERMLKLYIPEIKSRWAELRADILSPQNIDTMFEEFWYLIGTELLDEDVSIWANVPSKGTNNITQIRNFVRDRLNYVDGKIDALAVAVPCTGITLDQTTISIDGVGTQTITATVTPEDTTEIVHWTTSDESVAVVAGGVVTAVSNGNAVITATCGNHSASCTVTVTGIAQIIPCTGITLDREELSFTEEAVQTITATVTPADCTQPVIWASSDSTIASVVNGVVTPVANGSTTITATCGDYSATCAVTVRAFESLYPFEVVTVHTYSKRDNATGEIIEDTSGWYATTDPITLPVGCYRFAGRSYNAVYVWDEQGNYCGRFATGNYNHTFWVTDSMSGYKFAILGAGNGMAGNYEAYLIKLFSKVDNSTTAAEGQTVSLKDLAWTEGGANAVYAKVADSISNCSDPASNIQSLNVFATTLNSMVPGLPHYLTFTSYDGEKLMYYYGLGNAPATAVEYFTENDTKLIVNGGAQ